MNKDSGDIQRASRKAYNCWKSNGPLDIEKLTKSNKLFFDGRKAVSFATIIEMHLNLKPLKHTLQILPLRRDSVKV